MTSINHHLDEVILLDYHRGRLNAGQSLLVETHLEMCAHCRTSLRLFDAIGASMLEDIVPVDMADDALELALAGDIVFAAEGARFADTHAKWALTPVWGLSQRLPRRVGTYRAREMMFTCRTVMGPEASHLGLADFCVPDAEFDAKLEALADQILANSWFSHRANKRLVRETDGLPLGAGLSHEIYRGEGRGPDMADRIAGFQSKAVKQA